ncbi:hypothetical protein [Photobacterium nomapromontoriensis]|uniref:hypothetical protein n=1 Tax=Photobacterium nomapromontoriensis TaxID=2910237 RepID=UPI003D0FDB77
MQYFPICSQCGQSDEFLVADTGVYLCTCGHQFRVSTTEDIHRTHSNSNQLDSAKVSLFFDSYSTRLH